MQNKSHHIHTVLDGVITTAINEAIADKSLAKNVTKAVMDAIEAYEDDQLLAILQESEETERVSLDVIRDALKS